MSDSEDRHRADLFEMELRRKTALDPSNGWELIWFLGLPLEARCSYMRILEARIDQDATRRRLFRQSCYRQRSWRQPALPCMFLEPIYEPNRPWASLGRRQRRKPIEYGRASNRRTRAKLPPSTAAAAADVSSPSVSNAPLATQGRPATIRRRRAPLTPNSTPAQAPAPVPAPISTSAPAAGSHKAPPRPPTPIGLRDALHEDSMLLCQASGYSLVTLERESCTPRIPATPPEPVRYEPFPLLMPKETLIVNGKPVSEVFAFITAAGRHHIAPWQNYMPQEAARAIHELDLDCPGMLSRLTRALFPSGLRDLDAAINVGLNADTIIDFVRGMSIVPEGQMTGEMPEPIGQPQCSCGRM